MSWYSTPSHTLNGSLSMGDGSVLQFNGSKYASYYFNGNLEIAEEDTAIVNTIQPSRLFLQASSLPAGTFRLEGSSSLIYLQSSGTYNLVVANESMVETRSQYQHINFRVEDGKKAALVFGDSNSSANLDTGNGGEIWVPAPSYSNATVNELIGSGTLVLAGGDLLLEEAADFSGTILVQSGWYNSTDGGVNVFSTRNATLILGSADAASQATVELGEYRLPDYDCTFSLALEDGVASAELKSLKGSAYSRIKAGNYRLREGGSFAGTLEDGVTLTVGAGSSMDFAGARADDGASTLIAGEGGSTLANLTLGSGMVLGAQLAGTAQSVTLQNLTLESGGTILFDAQNLIDGTRTYDVSGTSTLSLTDGGRVALVIDGAESLPASDSYLLLGNVEGLLQGVDPEQVFDLAADDGRGTHLQYTLDAQSGDLVLTLAPITDYYRRAALSHNGQAGAAMIDALFVASQPQFNAPGSDAAALLQELDRLIEGGNAAAADNVMAAAAGASVTTLGMAFAADAQHRLNNIRDRISTLKLDSFGAPAGDPGPDGREPLNFWVNAEGGYLTLEQSGTAPGYSMTSWGGTVGVEASPRRDLSCGLAFSAIFSDLDADAADAASGDLDTYYLSAFGQYRSGAWKHTLVTTLGLADISLNRTVAHGSGSYRTSGDTDGLSLGFLYEITRDIPLNGANTAILQPLVNVSYLHTRIDGYTESGSDAALRFGDQNLNSVSFGAGARVQALAGESLLNRSALFEARALAKFNAGDRRSTAGVSFANGFGQAAVESAAMGVFGMELGAGVTVPLGREAGSIFADVSYELYREYSSLNAGVGYRLSF